jgi:hypothetical protein
MKKLSLVLLALSLVGMAGSALAGGPKNDIMHCGCVYLADNVTTGTASMVWKQLSIKNGNGHSNHVVDQLDDCLSGYDEVLCTQNDVDTAVDGCFTTADVASYSPQYTTFYRDNDDCLVLGTLSFLDLCDVPETTEVDETPVEGADCGFELELD